MKLFDPLEKSRKSHRARRTKGTEPPPAEITALRALANALRKEFRIDEAIKKNLPDIKALRAMKPPEVTRHAKAFAPLFKRLAKAVAEVRNALAAVDAAQKGGDA